MLRNTAFLVRALLRRGTITAMGSMDSPRRQRPLAGVDQALGEGRAREPTELLDQLRERLTRLDSGHPSASPRPADSTSGVADEESGTDKVNANGAASADAAPNTGGAVNADAAPNADRPDSEPARDKADSERAPAENSGGPTDASPSGDSWSQDAATADSGPASSPAELSPGWQRNPRTGEPYRPWFAGDDSITPWFAE
jgi:hypothetical protein